MNRSQIMSRIRSSGTKPEQRLWAALPEGRHNDPTVPGKPDWADRDAKVAVFVHGCFWHGHGHSNPPRAEWWRAKIERNRARDMAVTETLRRLGWEVLVIWECDPPAEYEALGRRVRELIVERGNRQTPSVPHR